MCWNDDGRILGNDTSSLLSSFLHDKASKTSQVNVIAFGESAFYGGHEGFNGVLNL